MIVAIAYITPCFAKGSVRDLPKQQPAKKRGLDICKVCTKAVYSVFEHGKRYELE